MWLTDRLAPDFKTIADFRKDNGEAIRLVRHMTTQQQGKTIHAYWTFKCRMCPIKSQCTSGVHREITRWEHEAVVEAAQARLDRNPDMMRIRRATRPFQSCRYPIWT